MVVSAGGLSLISRHEGVVYTAYPDPVHGWGVATICYGHTKGVRQGDVATKEQCTTWLQEDTAEATYHVRRLTTVPLSQGEMDAYVSFVFNAGPGNFAKSSMRRLLNRGERVLACNQLPLWNRAGGRVLPGLTKRRADEKAICLSTLP